MSRPRFKSALVLRFGQGVVSNSPFSPKNEMPSYSSSIALTNLSPFFAPKPSPVAIRFSPFSYPKNPSYRSTREFETFYQFNIGVEIYAALLVYYFQSEIIAHKGPFFRLEGLPRIEIVYFADICLVPSFYFVIGAVLFPRCNALFARSGSSPFPNQQ